MFLFCALNIVNVREQISENISQRRTYEFQRVIRFSAEVSIRADLYATCHLQLIYYARVATSFQS